MPKRKIEFVDGEIYHIVLRGVDGRKIFMDINDYWRGVFGIYEFNTEKPVTIREQRMKRKKFKRLIDVSGGMNFGESEWKDKRVKVVEVLAFVIMPNHIHLLVRQLKPNGVTLFVRKLGLGYAMYFNGKYERKGALFQGRFEAKHIESDEYLKTVFAYIHTNPISLIEPGWKEKGVENPVGAVKFLEEYKWSSYLDYLDKKNFPSVTDRDFILKIHGSLEIIREFVCARVNLKNSIRKFNING